MVKAGTKNVQNDKACEFRVIQKVRVCSLAKLA